jgi:hypothetical protein
MIKLKMDGSMRRATSDPAATTLPFSLCSQRQCSFLVFYLVL